jgi:Rieske Fe-S protein
VTIERLSRRRAVTGAAAVTLGVPLLAACSDDAPEAAKDVADKASEAASSGASKASEKASDAVEALATKADIPEGSGHIFPDAQVVVTQPTAGDFKAFSAVCTHQGCVVSEVTDTINCGCHGSKFAIDDGSVVQGPASKALPKAAITIDGDSISLG